MKVKDIMTSQVIPIHPEETVEVAARKLAHYNIGVLPVCETNGQICGLVTDRDLVTRCIAANRSAAATTVRQVMTSQVTSVKPDMDVGGCCAPDGQTADPAAACNRKRKTVRNALSGRSGIERRECYGCSGCSE